MANRRTNKLNEYKIQESILASFNPGWLGVWRYIAYVRQNNPENF